VAGLRQPVELLVVLDDTTFTAAEPLMLTCTEGLLLSGETLSDDGRLTPTDADSGKHELRVVLNACATFTDTCDSSMCYEVTLLTLVDTCDCMFLCEQRDENCLLQLAVLAETVSTYFSVRTTL